MDPETLNPTDILPYWHIWYWNLNHVNRVLVRHNGLEGGMDDIVPHPTNTSYILIYYL